MKKICVLVVTYLLLVSITACASERSGAEQTGNQTETTANLTTEATTVPDDTDEAPLHQELTTTEATINTASLRISIPEVGLENVLICDASHNEV